MKEFAEDVINFNQLILGIERRKKGHLHQKEFEQSLECLKEEVMEFEESYHIADMVGSVDAIIDLMYFAVGILYRMGLSADEISQCARIIHNCNMQKQIGIVERRGDGSSPDAVKPDNWKGPEDYISKILFD